MRFQQGLVKRPSESSKYFGGIVTMDLINKSVLNFPIRILFVYCLLTVY